MLLVLCQCFSNKYGILIKYLTFCFLIVSISFLFHLIHSGRKSTNLYIWIFYIQSLYYYIKKKLYFSLRSKNIKNDWTAFHEICVDDLLMISWASYDIIYYSITLEGWIITKKYRLVELYLWLRISPHNAARLTPKLLCTAWMSAIPSWCG